MQEIFDNIKTWYRFRAPCGVLSDYIEYFWELSVEHNDDITDNAFIIKLFPSWTPTFLINLGGPYHLVSGKESYTLGPEDDIFIYRDKITEYHHIPGNKLFGVKFFAGGLHALLNITLRKYDGRPASLYNILSASLVNKIKNADSFNERVDIMQCHLLNRHKNKYVQERHFVFIQKVIQEYAAGNMEFNNSEIAARLFTTPKTLYRNFNKLVGANPKNYFFIMRARTALTAYVNNMERFTPWDFGYYDMSHFYKDVIKFTGKKLSEQKQFSKSSPGLS